MSRRTGYKPRRKSRSPLQLSLFVVGGIAAVALAALIGILLAPGGDDDDDPGFTPIPTPTLDPTGHGPAPTFTEHLLDVFPEHASAVPRSQTVLHPSEPSGLCARISFEGIPDEQKFIWFRLVLNEQEVTDRTTIFEGIGAICFATPEGLPVGRNTAAIALQDPFDPQALPQEVVAWSFDITPD